MSIYYQDDLVTLYRGDCREVLPDIEQKAVLVTDPPYGINLDAEQSKMLAPNKHKQVHGDAEPFDPEWLLERFERAVIFGGNNFASRLPDSGAWIVWDKVTRNDLGVRIAECELAWTRGVLARTRAMRHMWSGAFRDSERGTAYHPCQKPVSLMGWVTRLVSGPNDVIVDPYAGSGATLIAARNEGRKAIGVEYDESYCEVIAKRLDQYVLDFGVTP